MPTIRIWPETMERLLSIKAIMPRLSMAHIVEECVVAGDKTIGRAWRKVRKAKGKR